MEWDEQIRQIVESSEPLTMKALRIADIEGSVDFKRITELFPDVNYNTRSNLLPHLKRQGLLTKNGELTDKGLEAVLPLPSWESLHSPDDLGKEAALMYMEQALEGLSGKNRGFVTSYLLRALCNLKTFDFATNGYRPRNHDFRKGAIISNAVKKYRDDDRIPPELYATLQLLPPDDRTANVLGEYLLGRIPREDGLRTLARMSSQKDPESAYRAAAEKNDLPVKNPWPYKNSSY